MDTDGHLPNEMNKNRHLISLSETFKKTIINVHKNKGKLWLEQFEELLRYIEEKWKLAIQPPFELSYNFVAPAQTDSGREVVVKLAVVHDEFYSEVEALQYFAGRSMVRVVDMEPERGILILERLTPGYTLAELEDGNVAMEIAADIMQSLWVKDTKTSTLPQIEERQQSLQRFLNRHPKGKGPISAATLQKALQVFKSLLSDNKQRYILHGDLHHYNILKGDNWTAIDPKGLVGEREYDTIQLLLNKLPQEAELQPILENRIQLLVKRLNLDVKRLLAYGFAHSTLSICWSLEEGEDYCILFYKSIEIFEKMYENSCPRAKNDVMY
ncbi:Aminoglycoside/hydroxyurea antibiotic resistance kinase [Bacillus sp. THAF10]|uniref:aminoglycoside phosphotransferase family protein n=1 Tax=Bacillus sp. THAF10 TaxID=2587848 RepID=UPI0012683420|nr:aminoglycoside phosphotransferase family protein [Bacillus sp. THAF10]QFT88301.1 Aminoglycoside/hydroxyurea antibiotic resistance kinase [Bacillus sp. THAF10]